MKKHPPLPPDGLPVVTLSIPELAAARAAGVLRIHDNGVLTLHRLGEAVVQVMTPAKAKRTKQERSGMSSSGDIPERERNTQIGYESTQNDLSGNMP